MPSVSSWTLSEFAPGASNSGLSDTEVRQALVRLIDQGLFTGNPIGAWQASVPLRIVNLASTSAGLAALTGD